MTRINATIDPYDLCDQHLVAEYREILRTVSLAVDWINPEVPPSFRLGTGHVKFFYDKLKFIHCRFEDLKLEMWARNFDANMKWDNSKVTYRPDLYNNWSGTAEANRLVIERIYERAKNMKKITHYGNPLSADEYYNMFSDYPREDN